MFKWFKRKEKLKIVDKTDNKMDLSKYKMKLNIKSICYFEKISGKSFFKFSEEDVLYLIYATFLINNPETNITFSVFTGILNNDQISKWLVNKYQDIISVVYQFNKNKNITEENTPNTDNTSTMTDFATSLIIDYGMSANYVMYEMDIWEIEEYFEAINTHTKREMENERFWTYIKVLPHIDGKKCKSPDALVPFVWEKSEKKARREKELENNRFAINNMIGKNIFGEPEEKTEEKNE